MNEAQYEMSSHSTFERLPKTVVPHVYNLRLNPDLQKFSFDGRVDIEVAVSDPTNTIFLNAVNLVFNSVSFTKNGNETKANKWSINTDTEIATIIFPVSIEAGVGHLSFAFSGTLNCKSNGFYRSKYKTAEGEVRYAAITQFKSTHARRVFPCWDEPAVKARFNITLVVPKDRVAISNMNVITEEADEDPSKKVVIFDTTPIMSTYLIAFVIGEYGFIEDMTPNRVKVRVYTPLGKEEHGRFALKTTVKVLQFYENYFDISYPLPKMDLIAIADFDGGAMENWGLVTFREPCILFDETYMSSNRKQFIVICISHELAHQWFGNLVTMDWWTQLWLNESFASFMQFFCTSNLHPEFDVWMQFVSDMTTAFELDGIRHSLPIEVSVSHPSEVSEIFDSVSYRKGTAVIRMLHEYIGDDCFRRGLNLYLKKHSYKNALTEDLWEALEEVCKKPVKNIMNTWTKQSGFPLISVSSRQKENTRILTLTQEKFRFSLGVPSKMDRDSLWWVPVSVFTPKGEAFRFLFGSKRTDVILDNVSDNNLVKLNPNGFFRVQYTSEMYSQFLPSIRHKSLPPFDRLSLHNNLFAVVQNGRAKVVDLLKMMEAYVDEDSYAVWGSINRCLGFLNSLLSYTDFQDNFHAYGRHLLSKINAKLGWNAVANESHSDAMLRAIIISRLVNFEDQTMVTEAKRRFHAYVTDGRYNIIPADIRGAVYCSVAMNADDETFETLFSLYRKSDLYEERNRIITSMAAVKDALKIQRLLDFLLSEEVRSQNAVNIIANVAVNKVGREVVWRFFQENFKELRRRYKGGCLMCSLIENITNQFASEEKALEIERFFSKNPISKAERQLQHSLYLIRLKADLLRDKDSIRNFLSTYV